MVAVHEAMKRHGLKSPYEERMETWKRPAGWDERVTTKVECADYFGVRDQALLAHATQIDPDGSWFAVPREIEKEAWPTEDFELVTSYVPVPEAERREEADLFAGLDVSTADDEGKAAVGREISFGKVVTA